MKILNLQMLFCLTMTPLLEIENFWHVVPTEILKTLEPPLDSENIVGKIA